MKGCFIVFAVAFILAGAFVSYLPSSNNQADAADCSTFNGNQFSCQGTSGCTWDSASCSAFNNNFGACSTTAGCSYPGTGGYCTSFNGNESMCGATTGCTVASSNSCSNNNNDTCSNAGCSPVNGGDCNSLNDGGGDGSNCATQPQCSYDSGSGVCSGSYFTSCGGDNSTCSGTYDDGSCTGTYNTGTCSGTYDGDAPTLSTAVVTDTTLTLTYNENLDANSVPAIGDFVVNVSFSPVIISSVSIPGGTTVVLTLAANVGVGSVVDVSYTAPGSSMIQDTIGNDAANLTGRSVTNNTASPVLSSAAVNRTTLTLTYSKNLDEASTPATTAYVVDVTGSPVTISSVAVSGSVVTITLAASVGVGTTVTLNYTNPGGYNSVQDLLGNDAADLTNQSVTNNTAPPALSAAVVSDATLTLAYNEILDASSTPATSAYVVNVTGSPVTISSVNVTGATVVLTLAASVGVGTTVTLNYTNPGSNPVQNSLGYDAANLSGQSVTNTTARPAISTAIVNRITLILTYNEALDTGSVPATSAYTVNVGGSPVTISSVYVSGSTAILTLAASVGSGTTVTVSYTAPGSNPIQDLAGNDAINLSGYSVTNNSSLTCSLISAGDNSQISVLVGSKLYAMNANSNSVSVIDTVTNTVSSTIAVGGSPFNASVVGTKVYVSNYTSNNVSVIDTTTDTVTATLSVGALPYSADVVGTKAYIPTFNTSKVYVINTLTNAVSNIDVGAGPYYSSVVGTKLYLGNTSDGTVSVIDTTTDTVSATITVGTNPHYSTAVGTKVYVINTNSNNVSVIDSTTDTVSTTITVGSAPASSYLVGTKLYVLNRTGGTVSVINTSTDTVSTTITVGSNPSFASVVGTKLYVNNKDSDTISVINSATDTVTSTISGVGDGPYSSVLVGAKLYVNDINSDAVSVVDTVNNTVMNVCAPQLTSITSSTSNGSYSSGQAVNITANFSKVLATSSRMRLTLNTGAVANLTTVSSSTLSGTYTVGGGEAIPDLSVSSISADSNYTNVSDASTTAPNAEINYSVPASPELTGDTYRNLGDLKNIIVAGPYCSVSVGTEPYQLATVGPFVYVANQGSDNVSVINTSGSVSVLTTISVGDQPYGVTYNSGSKEIYVANLKGNSVSVIDADPFSLWYNTVTYTISVGVEPYYVTSLSTKIYVTNNLSNTVSVINTATHTVSATVTVGVAPRGIKAHGTDIYVANFGGGYGSNVSASSTVSVIDSTNNTVSATINVGSGARGVAVNGDEVYVANFNDGTVSVINTGTNTVTNTITVGYHPRGVLSLGSNVYVENFGDGTISVIATGSHTVSATVKVGNTPAGMTAMGTDIYLSRFTDGLVSVLNTANNTMRSTCVDVTAPGISSVASSTDATTATITWITDEAADTQVNYGPTSSYNASSTLDATATTSHSVLLSGLSSATTYHFRVRSTDSVSNLATSTDYTFTTAAAVSSDLGGRGTLYNNGQTSVPLSLDLILGRSGTTTSATITATTTNDTSTQVIYPLCPVGFTCTPIVGYVPGSLLQNNQGAADGYAGLNKYTFLKDLSIGDEDFDVFRLQQFLNIQGFTVSLTGGGAVGNETKYFGIKTKTAVQSFQKALNIKPVSGFFGPITRTTVGAGWWK